MRSELSSSAKIEDDEQKLEALRAAIQAGIDSGVAEGDPIQRVLDRLRNRTSMSSVWLLWFEREQKEADDIELLIGVYRTEQAAEAAIGRLKDQPGFRDFPQGFRLAEYTLDEDHWAQGFVRE